MNNRKLLKANCYSRLSSNEAIKKTSKDRLQDKSKTMRQLNSVLHHYKKDNMALIEHNVKTHKSKGNKTARSPGRIAHHKKGAFKLNTIYKQLCEKVKILQATSQKLYEKSQRIKDYEQKCNAELDEREKQIKERERKIEQAESQQENKYEYTDIIQQLRNIDTKQTVDEIDIFDQPKEDWKNEMNQRISPNMYKNDIDTEESQNKFMLQSLEPNELELVKAHHKFLDADVNAIEAGTSMTNRKVDQSIEVSWPQTEASVEAMIINQQHIERIQNFDNEYNEFLNHKQGLEDKMRQQDDEINRQKVSFHKLQDLYETKSSDYDTLKARFEEQEKHIKELNGKFEDKFYAINKEYALNVPNQILKK